MHGLLFQILTAGGKFQSKTNGIEMLACLTIEYHRCHRISYWRKWVSQRLTKYLWTQKRPWVEEIHKSILTCWF